MSSGDREGDLITRLVPHTALRVTFDEKGVRRICVRVRPLGADTAVWVNLAPYEARDLAGRLQGAAAWVESLA